VQLAIVGGGALAGVALKLACPRGPRWMWTAVYVALGWVAVTALPDLFRGGGASTLAWLVLGGVAYSLGAAFYALRRPDPWPRVFGHHECFHACTLLGATCHHVAVYFAMP
jgi:hemolysin III